MEHVHKFFLRIAVVVAMILLSPLNIYSQQTKCNISGVIIDEKNQPVSYASVALYVATVPITGVVTGDDGHFVLTVPRNDKEFRLVVEFIGYNKFEKNITTNKPQINLGTIILKENALSLGEVVVSAKGVAQKATVEHTTLNASSNIVSSKGSALDILRTSSSVNVSNNNISIRGNSNILVLIDGIPTTTSDLSTIPAANIKSIEVVANPDASHDASGTGGIINIISNKTKTDGFSGVAAANYGFDNFATGNIAVSCNKEKSSWRFGYNTRYEDDMVYSTLYRKIKGSGSEVYQQMRSARNVFNSNVTFGADFRIDSRNKLSVDVKCLIPRLNVEQNLHNNITNNGSYTKEDRHNDITWNRENIESSVSYIHTIKPEVSDISIRGSVSKIWGHRPSYYSVDGMPTNHSVSGGSPFISALQADYKYKFKAGTFSAGAKLTYRSNDIYHKFYSMTNDGDWAYANEQSNDLLHTEFVPAVYTMFSSRLGKKLTYKVGVRGELSSVSLNSSHDAINNCKNTIFLAPTLSATYSVADGKDVSVALSRRVGRPSYPQLTPYMSMVDATTYEKGNMHLQPERSTKLDIGYNHTKENFNFFVNGYVNYTKDYISQITELNNNLLVTTYINAESDLKAGVELSLGITPAKWVNVSLNTNTYNASSKGSYDEAEIDNSGWTNNSNLMMDFMLWKGGEIQMQYLATTPQYFPQLTTSFTHQMNLGVKQRLLKGAMALSVLVTDVFNTAEWKVSSDNAIFALENSNKNKSRMLWVGVSYNFNKFKQKSNQKSDTDRSLIKFGM